MGQRIPEKEIANFRFVEIRNIVGVVLFNKIKFVIHRPHAGKHNYYHFQIEVKVGAKWKCIARNSIFIKENKKELKMKEILI